MKRIQRRRAKGWRLPEGAVIVDRTTPWGNPFVIGKDGRREDCVRLFRMLMAGYVCASCRVGLGTLLDYRVYAAKHRDELAKATALACPCPEGVPCHADVLIEWAAA